MIETAKEFILKLKNYYDEEISVELEDAITAYVRKKRFKGLELEALFELTCEHSARIPKVNHLAKIWKEHGQRLEDGTGGCVYADNALANNRGKGFEYVINDIKRLRREQENRDLKNNEIDLLHAYTDLATIYDMLNEVPDIIMPKQYKDTYLRKVKEDIDAGIPVNIRAARNRIEERKNQYAQTYGDEELEQFEKKSEDSVRVSYDKLVNVFKNNKQMLNPEPDRRSA
jgi:hypothetical protein